MELIPYFEIAQQDRYCEFTIPSPLFGREKELEMIRNIIRHTTTNYSRHLGTSRNSIVVGSSGSQTATGTGGTVEDAESASSKSDTSYQNPMLSPSSSVSQTIGAGSPVVPAMSGSLNGGQMDSSPRLGAMRDSPLAVSASPPVSASDGLRRVALGPSQGRSRTHAVVIHGPPGYVTITYERYGIPHETMVAMLLVRGRVLLFSCIRQSGGVSIS